jgi:hypothetical protein
MRYLLLIMVLSITALPVYAGQVVTANFDDLPAYTGVGDYYPGAFIRGSTYSSWSRSAPNCLYASADEPVEFRGGAV